ncbi:hypothetical protein EDC01DRAFT_778478 [Geopyxis carbonaria]|nr:hypothetical protein EDC01DRAFT_778478 [Geopyxis carbonaria]
MPDETKPDIKPAAGDGGEVEVITIVVRSQNTSELAFNAKMTMPFSKVANAWCKNQGMDPKTVRFCSEEGERLPLSKSIGELDLDIDLDEENDSQRKVYINAFMEQIGGC